MNTAIDHYTNTLPERKHHQSSRHQAKHVDTRNRFKTYKEDHCYQYDIRLRNAETDLIEANLTKEEVSKLTVKDFDFQFVDSKEEKKKLTNFIEKHEWLGTLSRGTTHMFGAYYKGILAGVIMMGLPNAFSKLLGENTKDLERLISRGACISWSPKNLASSLLMWSVNWMVKNTKYRLFTCYSDPEARELGTIYQACNFSYLGHKSGAKKMYINQYTGKRTSDRWYRNVPAYKIYAKEIGVMWKRNWTNEKGSSMVWRNVPNEVEAKLRQMSKDKQSEAERIEVPMKHKYVYVRGGNKGETKKLRKLFSEKNKVYTYPKERGKW